MSAARLVATGTVLAVLAACGSCRHPPESRRVPGSPTSAGAAPSVHDLSSLAFFATSGTFRVYKEGAVIEEEPVTDLRDGSLRFTVVGEDRAIIFGTQGTANVSVHRTKNSVSFIEETPLGNRHVFTAFDGWDPAQKGYRATYIRTIEFGDETMRTVYSGCVRGAP